MYYDTGAYFFEQIKNKKFKYRRIRFQDYVEHFHMGSYCEKNSEQWLESHKELWC